MKKLLLLPFLLLSTSSFAKTATGNVFHQVTVLEYGSLRELGSQKVGMPLGPKATQVELLSTAEPLKGFKVVGSTLAIQGTNSLYAVLGIENPKGERLAELTVTYDRLQASPLKAGTTFKIGNQTFYLMMQPQSAK